MADFPLRVRNQNVKSALISIMYYVIFNVNSIVSFICRRHSITISVKVMNNRQLLVIFNTSNYNNNCCSVRIDCRIFELDLKRRKGISLNR